MPDWIKNLLGYYIECAREDTGHEIQVSLSDSGTRFIPWRFSADLWHLNAGDLTVQLAEGQRGFATELNRVQRAGGSLFYGYPAYIEPRGMDVSVVPLLIWPLSYELDRLEIRIRAEPDWPLVNSVYLRKVASTPDEHGAVLESLGLLETEDDPPDRLLEDVLARMGDMDLGPGPVEPLDPAALEDGPLSPAVPGIFNRAGLFMGERPRFTAGLIRDLEEMAASGAPGWKDTALGTMLGVQQETTGQAGPAVEVVPLNDEQRQAVRQATSSPLTAVTGPPDTGKSQIVVSMIADSYLRGRRVLFTSKNNKAVDVVEDRVYAMAPNPLMIRTGSRAGDRDLRHELVLRLTAMLSLRPSEEDRLRHREVEARYDELRGEEKDLWAELRAIRLANSRLSDLDREQAGHVGDYSSVEWQRLKAADCIADIAGLKAALSVTGRYLSDPAGLLDRLSRRLSRSKDLRRIQSAGLEIRERCRALDPCPGDERSMGAWHTWLTRSLSTARALDAIDAYRRAFDQLAELRSRDEVARQLRRVRAGMTACGAELVSLHSKLASDRLTSADRLTVGNFRALQERLANDQVGGRKFVELRREMTRLFGEISRLIPVWCVTNLSARSSLPLKPNLFDLLIIDEASQCDIASALPLLYRSRRAVVIGDSQQLRHIARIEQRRDQQLQTSYGLTANDQIYAYEQNSLYDLTVTVGAVETPILLRNHYRSHSDIVGFSNRMWYRDGLRVWTDYSRLKVPPDGVLGIRWTDVAGSATRPPAGSIYIRAEADAVVDRVFDLLVNRGFDGTVGVVTPFRPQANMISERISQRVAADVLSRAQLIVETAHGFQGDERDVVLFSPCVSNDLPRGALSFLTKTSNLFNVTITRARSLLHVVGNRNACATSGVPHIRQFADYCARVETLGTSPYATTLASDGHIGPGEEPLYHALVARGLNPLPQHPVNQYRLDLAIVSGDIRIDVEVDGESTHLDPRLDAERDCMLENLGWRVVRFWNRQIRDDLDGCVRKVLDLVPAGI